MVKKLFLISVLAAFLFTGMANAQAGDLPEPGILPDSPLYFLKSAVEGVGTFFTFGDVAKADRFIRLAEKRLAEAQALIDKGKLEQAQKVTEKYEVRLAKALERAEKAKTKGKDTDSVLAKIAESTLRHQEVLARVYEKVPEQAKASIAKVMEKSAVRYETALNAISGEKMEEVKARIKEKRQELRARFRELKGRGIPIKIETGDDD